MRRNWRTYLAFSEEGRLQRAVLRARLVLFAQRLWRVLLWPLMVMGLGLLLVVTGILPALPDLPRLVVLLALVGAFLWLLAPSLRRLRFPSEEEGLARLEEVSGLHHQPLRTLRDELAMPAAGAEEDDAGDSATLALWQAHRARMRKLVRSLRAGWPRSDAPYRDPHALRFGLALALIAAFALNGPRFMDHLRESLRPPTLGLAERTAFLDAWIDPPAFVRKPPLVLATNGEVSHARDVLKVHQGSKLELRFTGATAPTVTVHEFNPATGHVGALLRQERPAAVDRNSWRLRLRLHRPVQVSLSGPVSVSWRFHVLADMAPEISLTKPPAVGPGGALVVEWRASDDHGVKSARAIIELHEPAEGMLAFDAPRARLKVLRAGKKIRGRDLLKLMAHPWAGLRVRLTLEATDMAGQTGRSKTHVFVLPTRPFSQLMARAIVEQRRELILQPQTKRDVAEVLMALLAWPVEMLRSSGAYLNLRQAAIALLRAETEEELKSIVELLWTLAEDIEDGDLAAAKRRLEAARKALEQALKNGASEEEIARRMAELKQALNEYLNKLARRQMQNGQPRLSHNGQMRLVRPQDLQRMLDRIEKLARGGAKEDAQRLLSQLDELLQGLQATPRMSGPPSPQQRALEEMQKLMREQQKLLDETWRRAQEPGQEDGNGQPGRRAMPDLQQRQERLAETLEQMLEQMQRMFPPSPTPPQSPRQDGQNGQGQQDRQGRQAQRDQPGQRLPGPGNERNGNAGRPDGGSMTSKAPGEALKNAERAMRGAARDLGKGSLADALRQQREALQALRRGARQMARQMARQQGRQRGGMAYGFMRQQYDPLGRPRRGQFMDSGPDRNIVPDENAAERARRILEYLRRRSEDATRPPLERNYIERLLKDIY